MSLLPREAQNLLHSRFSCMLIPFSMFSLDYDEGKVEHSPLYGRGKQSDDFGRSPFSIRNVCQWKEHPKKRSWDTFLLEIGDLTKSALFGWAYPTPLRSSSMSLLPREAQNLLHSRFSCMLIPFSMFSLDYDEGKVKYSPLYGRESKSDDFGRSPFSIRNVANGKSIQKNVVGTLFLLEIGDLTKGALFGWAYPTPLRSSSMSLLPREAQNLLHSRFFLHANSIFNVFT